MAQLCSTEMIQQTTVVEAGQSQVGLWGLPLNRSGRLEMTCKSPSMNIRCQLVLCAAKTVFWISDKVVNDCVKLQLIVKQF